MMDTPPESPLAQAQAYRAARRAFIAACEAAHVDTIARLHPSKPADGKPLFMDAAARGPRLAARALMAIATDAAGSAIAVALLKDAIALPAGTRLVMVHALDPAAFAGAAGDPAWIPAMLAAVAKEDMSRVHHPRLLPLGGADAGQRVALAATPLEPAVTILPPAATLAKARAAIADFFGG
jgi:Protein of unknown function (DUF2817)